MTTKYILAPAGRAIAFSDMKIPGAIDLVNENGTVTAVTQDGRRVPVSQ